MEWPVKATTSAATKSAAKDHFTMNPAFEGKGMSDHGNRRSLADRSWRDVNDVPRGVRLFRCRTAVGLTSIDPTFEHPVSDVVDDHFRDALTATLAERVALRLE